MPEPVRRARIRVHSRFGRRTGLPSSSREQAFLEKVFGPEIPLAPELRRDLLRRRLDEIDDDLVRAKEGAAQDLREERLRVAEAYEALGGNPSPCPAPPEPPNPASLVGDEPIVVLSVGQPARPRRPAGGGRGR